VRRKRFLNNIIPLSAVILSGLLLQACSTNPATGKQQFTALMSPQQENTVGAQEHEKIVKQYGLYEDARVNNYVREIGNRVTQKTERPDVKYKFYVLDSPIVNAFALPGGYIYISRGLLALANNEAQVAAVLAHEAGHITGRHSAERYSRGVVTSLGAGVLGAVLGSKEASQALGVGANLYLSSYSRSQENEADTLGLRYMTQGGYDPDEMAAFLSALQAQSGLDARLAGRDANAGASYFSTHPATGDRVRKTAAEAKAYVDSDLKRQNEYLNKIDGMVYGDSAEQGFTRGQTFYHPKIGFSFKAANGYRFINQTNQIIVTANNGSVVLFDMAKRSNGQSAASYIKQSWLKNKAGLKVENTTVNGMNAASASFDGTVNGKAVTLRVMAIEFKPGTFARFQVAIPKGASSSMIDDLKRTTYSFKHMTDAEKNKIKPYRLRVVNAKKGDTIASLANRLPYEDRKEERFRVLNSLLPNEALVVGRPYKIITD
jgi:predicted Zn-dependent protease